VVALAKIVSDFSATRIPNNASFNVTGLSSHNGINVIPSRAECLVEIRSTDQEILDVLGKTLQRTIGKHCNKTTKASFELLASTQAASYPSDSLLARKTAEAIRSIGLEPGFETGNTDGDVPLALGIPTVTVGASNAFATHSLKEHLEKRSLLKGIEQLIAVIFALDAIEEL
jgi:acetylornithine deacetylase/succinyl-diaminopimelate desuccinylase-like protein